MVVATKAKAKAKATATTNVATQETTCLNRSEILTIP
jgi:hypothetical protein